MTFTYRLYQYTNGLGQSVWRAKERGFLGLYWWVTLNEIMGRRALLDDVVIEWSTRDTAIASLRSYSQRKHDRVEASKTAAQRSKLTLVLVEDIEA